MGAWALSHGRKPVGWERHMTHEPRRGDGYGKMTDWTEEQVATRSCSMFYDCGGYLSSHDVPLVVLDAVSLQECKELVVER